MRKAVAVGLTKGNIKRFLAMAECINAQLTVLVLNEGMLIDYVAEGDIEKSKIKYRTPNDYVNYIDPAEFYTSLGQHCLRVTQEVLATIQSPFPFNYKEISLLDLIDHYIHARQVWPLFQRIYLFEQILKTEHPDEVWVCTDPRWKYVIREPKNIPFDAWLDYRAMENEAIVRVARSQGIDVRYVRPRFDDWRRYAFTRWGRPGAIRAYKQFQLFKSKIGTSIRALEFDRKDVRPLALTFVRSPVHKIRLYPVLEYLSREGWHTLAVEDYSFAVRQPGAVSSTVPEIDFVNWQGIHLYRHGKLARRFRQWLSQHQEDLPKVVYRDVDISDLFVSILWHLAGLCAEAAALIDAFERMLNVCNPDIVLLAHSQDLPGKTLACVCAQREIPTLTVQHGLMANPPLVGMPVTTDRYAVMGQMPADLLIRFGTSPQRIAVTGVPSLDVVISTDLSTSKEGKWVTLIAQPLPWFKRVVLPRFFQAARNLPKEQFVIKTGPMDSPSQYRNAIPNVRVIVDESLEEVLEQSKLVVGFNSTALFEAMQRRNPVIVAQGLSDSENPLVPGVMVVHPDADWTSIIRECLQNREMRQAMIDRQNEHLNYMAVQDRKAVERIASLVQEMVSL